MERRPLCLDAPNGTVVELHDVQRPLILPPVVASGPVKSLMRAGGKSKPTQLTPLDTLCLINHEQACRCRDLSHQPAGPPLPSASPPTRSCVLCMLLSTDCTAMGVAAPAVSRCVALCRFFYALRIPKSPQTHMDALRIPKSPQTHMYIYTPLDSCCRIQPRAGRDAVSGATPMPSTSLSGFAARGSRVMSYALPCAHITSASSLIDEALLLAIRCHARCASLQDLVPDRCGGRFVASHIRIEKGGPVPDYVHFHRVRFQCIFCYRGRVRVVYEGQVRIDVVVLGALLWSWAHCFGPGHTVYGANLALSIGGHSC